MRVECICLMLVAVGLAGCAEGGEPAQATDDEAFEDLDAKATSTTGIIRGVVVDESIVPIPEATITIKSLQLETTSNENGAFLFEDLEPGTYFMDVSKIGYTAIQAQAQVEAGIDKPPVVRVQLAADPSSIPYAIPFVFDGILRCSVRTPAIGTPCDQTGTLGDEFVADYELDEIPDMSQGELVWDSNQALGDGLSYNWRKTGTNNDYHEIEGVSPLVLRGDQTMMEANDVGAGQPLRQVIFTGHNPATEPPGGILWGVGVQIDQQFKIYTHVFYGFTPAEDWMFITDGEPVPPS